MAIHKVSSNASRVKGERDAVRNGGKRALCSPATIGDHDGKEESTSGRSFLLDWASLAELLRRLAPKRLWWQGGCRRNPLWDDCGLWVLHLGMDGGFYLDGEVRLVGGMLWR